MNIGAYFYNHNLQDAGGKMDVVVNIKNVPDQLAKAVVADYRARSDERASCPIPGSRRPASAGGTIDRDLFDEPGEYGGYLHPRDVIHWLIDTVSKNGTFILNIPGRPDGTIDTKEIAVLDQITAWMQSMAKPSMRPGRGRYSAKGLPRAMCDRVNLATP